MPGEAAGSSWSPGGRGEPVAKYRPFVMNSYDEIRQAVVDFQAGRF